MAPNNIAHTYVSGGTVAAVFTEQVLEHEPTHPAKCADDVKKIYLAVVHDVTRGGNWKSVSTLVSSTTMQSVSTSTSLVVKSTRP